MPLFHGPVPDLDAEAGLGQSHAGSQLCHWGEPNCDVLMPCKTNHSDTVQIWIDLFIASHFHLHLGQVSNLKKLPFGGSCCVRHWVSCPRVTSWKSKPWESLQEALWMTFSEASGRFTSSYKSSVHRVPCIAGRLHHLAICRKDGTFMPSRGSGFCLRRCVGLQSPMLVLQHQTKEGRGLWIVTSASRMHARWNCCIRRRRCQRQMEGPKWTTIGILQRRCSVTRISQSDHDHGWWKTPKHKQFKEWLSNPMAWFGTVAHLHRIHIL